MYLYNIHRYNEVDGYYRIGSGENILHTILKSSHFFVSTGQLKKERQGFYSEWIYLLTPVGGKLMKGLKFWLHNITFLLNGITFSVVEKEALWFT